MEEYKPKSPLPYYLFEYLNNYYSSENKRAHETLILMILYKDYIQTLRKLIHEFQEKESFKIFFKIEKNKDRLTILRENISGYTKYESTVIKICNSKYFKENFNKNEIKKRKEIALHIPIEIYLQEIWHEKNMSELTSSGEFDLIVSSSATNSPLISHTYSKSGNILLNIDTSADLDEITYYLKEVLDIKNRNKKFTKSLWESYVLKIILDNIKEERNTIKDSYNIVTNTKTNNLYKSDKLRTYKNIYKKCSQIYKKYIGRYKTPETIKRCISRLKNIETNINM